MDTRTLLFVALGAVGLGCGGGGEPPITVDPGDADADTDADSDTDGDSDTDADSDTDSDSDACPVPDADRDGRDSTTCGGDDCNDADATVLPGATDPAGDDVDQNCDGSDGTDADGDGHASLDTGGDDCADLDPRVHPGAPDEGWTTETVDSGWSPSIALDADGNAHLTYASWLGSGLRYATNESGAWDLGWAYVGEDLEVDSSSIVLDPDGNLQVAFDGWPCRIVEASCDSIWHSSDESGEWESGAVIEPSLAGAQYQSFAVDATGVLHVAYSQRVDMGIVYATRDAFGVWTTEVVAPSARITSTDCLSIAVDSAGVAYIGYFDTNANVNDFLIATNRGGAGWVSDLVDAGDASRLPRAYCSVAVTSDDQVHAAYVSGCVWDVCNMDELRHVWWDAGTGSYAHEVVDADGERVQTLDLVVDETDLLHLGYESSEDVGETRETAIRYATQDVEGTWTNEFAVDAWYSHLSFDVRGGVVQFAYVDSGWVNDIVTTAHGIEDGVDDDCDGEVY